MFDQKVKLILVCSGKTEKFANYLQLMLSACDDQDDNVIGVKDGSVETVVWSERDYLSNKPTLSSSDHILFVGPSKKLKDELFGMRDKFNKFGMKYAWLGKRGLLSVDSGIKRKEYDEFLSYAVNYISDMEREMDSSAQAVVKDATTIGVGVLAETASVGAGVLAAGGAAALLPFAVAVFAPVGAVGAGVAGLGKLIRHNKEKRSVEMQQYTCLILKFYLEGIQEFLNQ